MNFPAKASIITKSAVLAAMGCILSTTTAHAAGFTSIRIGDMDGFGYGNGAGYNAANGSAVNVDGQGLLGNGDFLPDLNDNGIFATYQGDDFDNRSGDEKSNVDVQVTGNGFRDNGSSGSQFTDLSLSTSYLDTLAGVTPLTEQREALRTQRLEVQGQIDSLDQQIQPIQKQIDDLWSERKGFADQRTVVRGSITEINSQIQSLQSQGAAQSQINELKGQRDNLKAQRTELTGQIDTVQARIDTWKIKRTPLTDQKAALQVERAGIQTTVNTLNLEIEALRAEYKPEGSKIPQPAFTFDFAVDQGKIVEDSPLYFNLLFADYDVKDAEILFTTANGSFTRQLTRQQNKNGFDGWVQSAFVELGFDEVFTATEDGFDGLVTAEIIAPDEPYLAFDFAEISASKIAIDDNDMASVPEPASMFGLFVFGAVSTCALKKRK